MNLTSFLVTDSDGKKSLTATAFILGFAVCNLKLVFSGMEFGDFTLSPFSGTEYAAAVAALGAIYVLRRSNNQSNGGGSNAE